MRQIKNVNYYTKGVPLTKDEMDIINAIQKDAQVQIMKFVNNNVLKEVSKNEIDVNKHTYQVKYSPSTQSMLFRRVVNNAKLTETENPLSFK